MEALLGLGLFIMLFAVLIGLAVFGFWLWMLIDCLVRQEEDKLVWLLVIFFLSFVGALVYYFVARKKRLGNAPPAAPVQPAAPPAPAYGSVPPPPPAPAPARTPPSPVEQEATMLFQPEPKVRLIATLGPLAGMSFPLTEQGAIIGRSATADIAVADGQVSNRHAWVGMVAGKPVVRDQGSTNGTYLNDFLNQPVIESELRAGDTLVLGKHNAVKFQIVFD